MNWKKLKTSDGTKAVLSLSILGGLIGLYLTPRLESRVHDFLVDISNPGKNAVDERRLLEDYYDPVVAGKKKTIDLFGQGGAADFEGEETLPEGWVPIEDSTCVTYEHDDPFLIYVLKPNHTDILKGATNTTNRWGMRDKDYELDKPANTFRIALAGASNDMGSGVEYEEGFVTLVEERLNRELGGRYYDHYEIINFSVGGYFMLERLWVLENHCPRFNPDLIICTTLKADRGMLHNRLAKRMVAKPNITELHYDFLKRTVRKAGIRPTDLPVDWPVEKRIRGEEAEQLAKQWTRSLAPFKETLMVGCLEEMNRFQVESGIPVAAMVLHREPGMRAEDDKDTVWVARQCEEAGLPTLRIYKAYEDETEDMILHPQDRHPSVKAHKLLADDIYETMTTHPVIGPMLRKENRR